MTQDNMFDKPFAYGGFKADASSSRTCFGIAWFYNIHEAEKYSEFVKKAGHTYNGGYFHGMSCGRDPGFDTTGPEGKLFAVTHQ